MRRARRAVLVGAVACLPLLLATVPALASRLGDVLTFRPDSVWQAHSPDLHRGAKVRVTGAARGHLRPGTSAPVALRFENPNAHQLRMNRVRVTIAGISAPNADATHPCTTEDFAVRQMPRQIVRLPARGTTDLAALGVPLEAWPRLTMLARPVNQDGCQGASLTLRFKARGLHR